MSLNQVSIVGVVGKVYFLLRTTLIHRLKITNAASLNKWVLNFKYGMSLNQLIVVGKA